MKAIDTSIQLSTPLSVRSAFRFPLQTRRARWEVLAGAVWLLVPFVGWLLNMGHRIAMTHRMQHGLSPWPAWNHYGRLFRDGVITFLGMVEYHAPAIIVEAAAWKSGSPALHALAALLWVAGTVAVPGYMTHYCFTRDPREVFDPRRAMRRVFQGGRTYWKAWGIALLALAVSLSVLGAGGGLVWLVEKPGARVAAAAVGGFAFLVASVWFWQVAGFAFASVFTQRFGLYEGEAGRGSGKNDLFSSLRAPLPELVSISFIEGTKSS